MGFLDRFFKLKENSTTVKTELMAGSTTFMTMAYIIFLQPAVLSAAGMDFDAVMMATCISSALASVVMGLLANYPIALAPGLGLNFFFAYTVVLAEGVPWQTALGVVFFSGVLFIILNVFGIREAIVNAIPASLKSAIAAGIGFFIAFIGLSEAGIITRNNAPLASAGFEKELPFGEMMQRLGLYEYAAGSVKLGDLSNPVALLALFGLVVTLLLMLRKIRGSILWGIIATLIAALVFGQVHWQGITAKPPSISATLFKLDLVDVFRWEFVPIIVVFFFTDVFDTLGTLVGVGTRAGFVKDGKLLRASRALWADAIGTVTGALLGTSTVTSYIESAAGVEEGGRTGLAAVTTGILFLVAIFFAPLVRMIGGGIPPIEGSTLFLKPITAPALIIVGCLMVQMAAQIKWSDFTESFPAFLVMLGMPLTYSISDGMAFGFISYPLLKIFSGKAKQVSWLVYLLGIIFLLRYIIL